MSSGRSDRPHATQRRSAAETVGTDDLSNIRPLLDHEDASIRYWGTVACSAAKSLDHVTIEKLIALLDDKSPAVQIEAAGALARHGDPAQGNATLAALLSGDDLTVLLHAARTVEVIGDPANRAAIQALFDRFEEDPRDMAWFIRFTATGYLSRLDNGG